MRIGIITLPLHTNYGGILQAYALQTVLERMGHEVMVIQKWWPKGYTHDNPFVRSIKNLIKNITKCRIAPITPRAYIDWEYDKLHKNVNFFIRNKIHLREVNTLNELQEGEFDAIVVGSDQIWRALYVKYDINYGLDGIYDTFLRFTDGWNIRRVSYAASFGTDSWEYTPEETKACADLISKFEGVSVREDDGILLCSEKFNVHAVKTLDPTLLLPSTDYEKLITDNEKSTERSLVYYLLDESQEKIAFVEKVAKQKGLGVICVNSKFEVAKASLEERVKPSVSFWLNGFRNASYVITDSFHACAFSIIFNKPFAVLGNSARGNSRFESLLNTFSLKHCLQDGLCVDNLPQEDEFDWTSINNTRIKLSKDSIDFLFTNLNK